MEKNKALNIIYFICHDIGKELGCYGKPIDTPNLDRFANKGVKFTNYFCSSPACMPSRCCAYTGLYAHSNGVMGLPSSNYSLDDNIKTVVDYFNENGYETVHVGFQHERSTAAANRYQIELYKEHQDIYVETAVDKAIEYLANRQNSKKPFYLNIGTIEVHASQWMDQIQKNNDRKAIYGTMHYEKVYMPPYISDVPVLRKEMGNFQACIQYFDKQAKRLFDAIRDMGYEKDALVVCTTDHGISNEHAKGTLYDAGVEIMMLIQLPGLKKAGMVVDHLIQNIDIAPTFLDAAGIPIPENIQGKSFWPLLNDGEYTPHKEIFIERNYHGADQYDPMRAVRSDKFHYIRNFDKQAKKEWIPSEVSYIKETYTNWINQLWPEHTQPRDEEELFDIINDPNEFHNLAYEEEYQNIRCELAAKLDNWMHQTNDPLLKGPIISPKRRQAQITG